MSQKETHKNAKVTEVDSSKVETEDVFNDKKKKGTKKDTTKSDVKEESNFTKKSEPANFQTASTRTYLEQNVVSVVMQGMTELAKERPDNPLEFLGNFLLKHSNNK